MNTQWTFVTNHALVLVALFDDPRVRQRDIAEQIGITQGAVQRILHDLVEAGYISAERVGRRNHYHFSAETTMRHAKHRNQPLAALLRVLADPITGRFFDPNLTKESNSKEQGRAA